ncbi:hypothetical protein amrb99_58930 [Actinomadura sp. RB99]|uniref:PAS domain-containing protein n=1 Tax=Actinomadura sp. RB99 TaxID=2691577 RepID=UPI0016869B33|nr:PAS domain-containing protein [Actinomadura sp. RB99]MBD2896941.1 hypothetical protein [Actinomadura sp. RB99]
MGWLALEAFDPAPVAVALTIGPERRLVYTNLAFRAFVGDRRLGEPIGRALGAAAKQDYGELFDRVPATGEPVSLVEAPVKPADADAGDAERYFSFTLSRFTHERLGVLVVAADVTEQVAAVRRADRATEEHRRSRRRFESMVWINARVVRVSDAAGNMIESSKGRERITGQSRQEFLGDGWWQALHPNDRELTLRSWNRTRRAVRPWRYVYRVRTRDGEDRHFDVRAAPVVEGGAVVEWIGTCFDIELEWQPRQRRELLDRCRGRRGAARTDRDVRRARRRSRRASAPQPLRSSPIWTGSCHTGAQHRGRDARTRAPPGRVPNPRRPAGSSRARSSPPRRASACGSAGSAPPT